MAQEMLTSPSGKTLETSMTEGETSFLVLEPLEADDYTCRINPLGRAMQCLYANDSLFEKATVKVDTVEVRLMLLETETNETKEITDEQDHRIHEAVEERSKLETAMKKENTQMQKMMKTATKSVFFLTYAKEKAYRTNEKILGSSTLGNSDNSYNEKTGVFTAPVTGTYLFFATATVDKRSDNRYSAGIRMKVDTGKRQQVSECWTSNMNTKQMGNCQAVLALTAGQKVYLENAGGNRVFFEPMSTTFGGVLMKVDMSSKL
nr:hypothetical protein BaRGS_008658 [Batillaria attramentaria]